MIRIITQVICRRVLWMVAAATVVLPSSGWATASYTNTFGYYTGSNNLPIIDAVTWVNDANLDNIITTYPWDVTSVVYMTNRADISGRVGFRFDTVDEVNGKRK